MAQYKGAASEAGRAMQLMKKREKEREQLEQLKQKIAEDNMVKSNIDKKFSAHYDAVEAELKSSTVGLVTLNDMKAKQEALVKEREKQLAKKEQSKELQLKLEKQKEKKRKEEQKRKIASLSFNPDGDEEEDGEDEEEDKQEEEEEEEEEEKEEEEEEEEEEFKKKKLGKNPDVDTSFLPDRDREVREEIEITFSYWDGSGHRRTVKMKKGNTIQQFLQKALEVLRKDFSELRSAGVEQLMYIKEDLIIPHHHSFYDFIVTKARGKSGPLFNFDVHDDVRLVNDATVEKDESHAGKVVLRSWYEKNKHIFPASRWEPYDPEKKWDKYTVSAAPPPPRKVLRTSYRVGPEWVLATVVVASGSPADVLFHSLSFRSAEGLLPLLGCGSTSRFCVFLFSALLNRALC
uniref:Family with sequence similarity 50 member A n=1 Tax=Scleropages formosus TaxID=113540 RepID=A0A8C9SRI7_SCLFO